MKKFKENTIKGFNIIEMMIVVAIIGILASVIVANLSSARNKSADLSIKTNLENLKPQSEIYFNINKSFSGFCEDDLTVVNLMKSAAKAAGLNWTSVGSNVGNIACNSDQNSWAAIVKLKSNTNYYCIDNTGKTIERDTQIIEDGSSCN